MTNYTELVERLDEAAREACERGQAMKTVRARDLHEASTAISTLERENCELRERLEVCALVLESQGAYQTAQLARATLKGSEV